MLHFYFKNNIMLVFCKHYIKSQDWTQTKTTGNNIKEHILFVVCICYFASNDFTCRHLQALIGG